MYFADWYRDADPNSYARLSKVREFEDGRKIPWSDHFFAVADIGGMAQFVEQHRNSCNLYASANTFRRDKGAKEDVAQILRNWVDIDPDENFTEADVVAEAASITSFSQKIHTGGGVQVSWRLPEPVLAGPEAVAAQDQCLNDLVDRHHGDSGAKGVNRVLRIPGTLNFPTRAKAVDKGRGWEPRPVSEPEVQDAVFSTTMLSTPQVITAQEAERGVTRDTCLLALNDATWDLIENGGEDLSQALFSVIHSLILKTEDDALIADIILYPNHAIGEHRRGREAYLNREIEKARQQNPFANEPEADELTAAGLFLGKYSATIRAVPAHDPESRWMVFNPDVTRWEPRRSVQDQIVPIANIYQRWAQQHNEAAVNDRENRQWHQKKAQRFMAFANRLRTAAGSKALEDYLIRSHSAGIVMQPTDFDVHHDLIGVRNGVLSLSKRQLVDADPEDYVYRSLGAALIEQPEAKFFNIFRAGLGDTEWDIQQYLHQPIRNGL